MSQSRPIEYEIFVQKLLAGKLYGALENADLQVFRRKSYVGSSGHSHEVDVSAEFRIAGLRFLVLVECKCLQRRVEVGDILEFAARL